MGAAAASVATVIAEAAHSPYGPSGAKRWLSCPGVINATKGMPDTDSSFAIEGSAAHTLSEWCRLQNKPASTWISKFVDVELVDGSTKAIKVTQSMADAVQEFVDYVNALGGDHVVEEKVRYNEYVPGGYGRLDHASLHVGFAHVVDLKYGLGVEVDAENNEQLMCYALGIYLELDWMYGFEKFILTVHQPRRGHVDTWEISVEDLLKWARETLAPGYQRTLAANAPLKSGTWCRFCKLDGVCRQQALDKLKAAQSEFEDLNAPLEPSKPAMLTNDELAAIRPKLAEILSWAKAVSDRIMGELQHGRAVGNLKLVAGKSSRQWGVGEEEVVKALELCGIPEEKVYAEPKLLTPPALEKVVGKTRYKKDVADLVVMKPGKPTIADGDDKRPALTIDALNEFSNLNEGESNDE